MSSVVGLGCLLFFAVSQGVRDVFFGNAFQSVSFFLVAVLAFGASTICFTTVALLRRPSDLSGLLAVPGPFAALNVATAAAWLGFFFGLWHLEPAVVATLYNGVGPLTVLAVQAVRPTAARDRATLAEATSYAGVAATLAALAAVVLTGRSGLPGAGLAVQAAALAAVVLGGAAITVGHMIARWFNDRGVGSDSVMGTRFLLTLLAAGGAELLLGSGAASWPPPAEVAALTAISFALIVVPSFVLQLGIARTSPLAVNVFRSLGPVCVFLIQQTDGRLRFSGATLLCAVAFGAFTICASLLRARSELRRTVHRS